MDLPSTSQNKAKARPQDALAQNYCIPINPISRVWRSRDAKLDWLDGNECFKEFHWKLKSNTWSKSTKIPLLEAPLLPPVMATCLLSLIMLPSFGPELPSSSNIDKIWQYDTQFVTCTLSVEYQTFTFYAQIVGFAAVWFGLISISKASLCKNFTFWFWQEFFLTLVRNSAMAHLAPFFGAAAVVCIWAGWWLGLLASCWWPLHQSSSHWRPTAKVSQPLCFGQKILWKWFWWQSPASGGLSTSA